MNKKSDAAVGVFETGFNCAQAVFTAFSDELGLDRDSALKVSCGFGGGLAHSDGVCGAVSGAIMAISLKYGKSNPEDNAAKEKTYMLINRYLEDFKTRHGSINCTALIGYNLKSAADADKAREAGVFTSVCPELVRDSVELTESLI